MKTLEIPSLHPHGKGYRIVFEKTEEDSSLSEKEQERFEDIYAKIQQDPQKHISELEAFAGDHPHFPQSANLLAFAYLRLKRKKEAEELIAKTYLQHPDYLIAKLNYADQMLRHGFKEKIPEIFRGCFELNQLYPEKESFYYSEFRGFMVLMGFYHFEIGKKEKAEEYYQLAFQVDPLHPSVASLEKKLLKKSFLKKIIEKLAPISKKRYSP